MCILLTQTICMVCNMQKLNLFNTKIGDAGVIKFSEAIAGGALARCETLVISANQIGDVGMQAFSSALATGALALLNDLYLDNNPISDDAKHAMRTAMSNRSGKVHF